GHDQRTAAPVLLEPGQLENRLHRLLTGPVDERASVHDDALRVLGPRHQGKPRLAQHPEHQLGIHLILRTPQRREINARADPQVSPARPAPLAPPHAESRARPKAPPAEAAPSPSPTTHRAPSEA